MNTSRFSLLTNEMLEQHIERLERLSNTSEDTDEYCRLMAKLDEARTELASRRLSGAA